MTTKIFAFSLILALGLAVGGVSLAQAPSKKTIEEKITGTVEDIAEDGTYLIVDGTKILTTLEFLEDTYLEVGDKVEITAIKTDQGLEAKDCKFVWDEEEGESWPEEERSDQGMEEDLEY